jgi:hypothetical protein
VLVHCAGGVSRSATIVLGYLMAKRNMTFESALSHLRAVRPWVNPNEGFAAQLREFERLGRDPRRWRAWRHVWRPAGGAAGAGGYQQMVIAIPPPREGQQGGSGDGAGPEAEGAPPAAAGQIAAELLSFSRLRVDGEAARQRSYEQLQLQQRQQLQQQQ